MKDSTRTVSSASTAIKESINSLAKELMADAIKLDINVLSGFGDPMIIKYVGSVGKVISTLMDYSDSLADDLARKDEQIAELKAMLEDSKARDAEMKGMLAEIITDYIRRKGDKCHDQERAEKKNS